MSARLASLFSGLALLVVLALSPGAAPAKWKPVLGPRVGLNAFAALVDQQFAAARNGLRILAATENAASADWSRIEAPLAVFARATPASAAVWFARPDGSYFTVHGGPSSDNLRDRGYFPRLIAGQEVLGDLVVSKSTGKRSAIIAVPVKVKGRVVGAVGLSMAMEKVAALVDDEIGFAPDVMFYALNNDGQIALHRQTTLLFDFAGKLGSPSLTAAVKDMLAQPAGTVQYEFQGKDRKAIFKKSDTTGFVYALRW